MDKESFATVHLHEILDRWQAGDRGAADELLTEVSRRLERLTRAMLRNYPNVHRWADTGDVLQDSTLRLLRTLQQLRPTSIREFYGLASLHIRRELLDLARHYGGPQGLGANHASLPPGSSNQVAGINAKAEQPEDDLELWCSFHKSIEELPDDEREVVSLVFYHGWDQARIAELLQVSVRTIRRRWQSACIHLRDTIGSELTLT